MSLWAKAECQRARPSCPEGQERNLGEQPNNAWCHGDCACGPLRLPCTRLRRAEQQQPTAQPSVRAMRLAGGGGSPRRGLAFLRRQTPETPEPVTSHAESCGFVSFAACLPLSSSADSLLRPLHSPSAIHPGRLACLLSYNLMTRSVCPGDGEGRSAGPASRLWSGILPVGLEGGPRPAGRWRWTEGRLASECSRLSGARGPASRGLARALQWAPF